MTMIYPGSFDPITNGHYDIALRASRICDRLIVAIGDNPFKRTDFSLEARLGMLRETFGGHGGIEVEAFKGLLAEYAVSKGAGAIIKGLRTVSDYEYELQMATLNKNIAPGIETLFMVADIKYSYLSSSIVKELARYGGDISGLVPAVIIDKITS